MTIAVVQFKAAILTSGGYSVTFDAAPIAGNYVIFLVSANSDATGLPAATNSYTKIAGTANASFLGTGMYWKLMSGSPSATQACTSTTNGADEITAYEISGLDPVWANNLDSFTGKDFSSTTAYNAAPPTAAPSGHDAFCLLQVSGRGNSGTPGIPTVAGLTSDISTNFGSRMLKSGHATVSSGGSQAFTTTFGANTDQAAYGLLMLIVLTSDVTESLTAATIAVVANAVVEAATVFEDILVATIGFVAYQVSSVVDTLEHLTAATMAVVSNAFGEFVGFLDSLRAATIGIVANALNVVVDRAAYFFRHHKKDEYPKPRTNPAVLDKVRTEDPRLSKGRGVSSKLQDLR